MNHSPRDLGSHALHGARHLRRRGDHLGTDATPLHRLNERPRPGVATWPPRDQLCELALKMYEFFGEHRTIGEPIIGGMRIVQLFGREAHEVRRFDALNQSHLDAHLKSITVYALYFPLIEFLTTFALASLLVTAGFRVGSHAITVTSTDVSDNESAPSDAITITVLDADLPYGVMNIGGDREEKLMRYIEVLENCLGKKAKKSLEGIAKTKEDKLKKMEADLKVKGDDFKKKASIYDEATTKKKQMELQKEFYDLQQLLGQSQNELRQKEEEALKPIVTLIRQQIETIAKKENYTIVLERSENLVLFAKKEIDLTDQVVKAYEKAKK
jgi:Skp family chaperone for outer membrane proteins